MVCVSGDPHVYGSSTHVCNVIEYSMRELLCRNVVNLGRVVCKAGIANLGPVMSEDSAHAASAGT